MNDTLQQVADTALDQPLTITVDVAPQYWWQRWLQQWRIWPKKKQFQLRPLYLGTLLRISRILLAIQWKMPGKEEAHQPNLLELNYEALQNHSGHLAQVVALAITNTDRAPSPALTRFILQNFTSKELMGVLALVLKQMDLSSFMISITSVKGLNVLEMPAPASAIGASGEEVSL